MVRVAERAASKVLPGGSVGRRCQAEADSRKMPLADTGGQSAREAVSHH